MTYVRDVTVPLIFHDSMGHCMNCKWIPCNEAVQSGAPKNLVLNP